jgi:hypothetical protein
LRVAAFDGVVVGCDNKTVAFTPDPDGRAMGRAVSEQGGEMGEVAPVNQANDVRSSSAGMVFSSGTLRFLCERANLIKS